MEGEFFSSTKLQGIIVSKNLSSKTFYYYFDREVNTVFYSPVEILDTTYVFLGVSPNPNKKMAVVGLGKKHNLPNRLTIKEYST